MKRFILIIALLTGMMTIANTVSAQHVSVNININTQPAWGPVGYDYVNYYYFPELNCYYDVNGAMFVYFDSGRWISARYLPYSYRNYDLYRTYKVVLNTHNPWVRNSYHYTHYAPYRGYNHKQVIIRDSRDHRYSHSQKNQVVWYNNTNTSRRTSNVQRPVNSARTTTYSEGRQTSRNNDRTYNRTTNTNSNRNSSTTVNRSSSQRSNNTQLAENRSTTRSSRR